MIYRLIKKLTGIHTADPDWAEREAEKLAARRRLEEQMQLWEPIRQSQQRMNQTARSIPRHRAS